MLVTIYGGTWILDLDIERLVVLGYWTLVLVIICHVVSISCMTTYQLQHPFVIALPTGHKVRVNFVGKLKIHEDIVLQHVLYVPEFKLNLLSK